MGIRKIIRRVIREETLPSPSIRRRMDMSLYDNVLNELKKVSLRALTRDIYEVDNIVDFTTKWVAEEIVPYDEDYDEDYDGYVREVSLLLKKKFEESIIEYITRVMNTFDGPTNYMYEFKKHSERYGGRGFSTTFDTWGDLIKKYGYWMPLEWDKIKRELDIMDDEGEILISRPGEPTNTMGYYFSVGKISK